MFPCLFFLKVSEVLKNIMYKEFYFKKHTSKIIFIVILTKISKLYKTKNIPSQMYTLLWILKKWSTSITLMFFFFFYESEINDKNLNC